MPSRTKTSGIVGKRIRAEVAEPWDFKSSAGDNVLSGTIADISADNEIPPWILLEVSPFDNNNHTISTVAGVRRYADDDLMETLSNGSSVTLHLFFDTGTDRLTPEQVRSALKKRSSLPFLIASVQICGD